MHQPIGLYFDTDAVQRAQQNRHREPFKTAFAALDAPTPRDPLAAAVIEGFRFRFNDDTGAAQRAAKHLAQLHTVSDAAALMAAGQGFALVREMLPDQQAWLAAYRAQLDGLHAAGALLDDIWRTAAQVVGAVLLDDRDRFDAAAGAYEQIIQTEIHPEGYLPKLVENSSSGALARQLMAAKGLVLAAEASRHGGESLWDVEARGISTKTAAIYAAAYYEYRETWPWDTPPSAEETETLYCENAGFFEMLNRQLRPEILRDTMRKLRPLTDPYGGGVTTLSHAPAPRRGLFGFGR